MHGGIRGRRGAVLEVRRSGLVGCWEWIERMEEVENAMEWARGKDAGTPRIPR